MKKFILVALALISMSAMKAENYMFGSLSYENTHFGYKSTFSEEDEAWSLGKGLGLNGFGLQYTYGLGITDKPMNIEIGLNWSMVFGSKNYKNIPFTGFGADIDTHINLMRLNIPVSYIYHFPVWGKFSVSPYVGLDFRFNLLSKMSIKTTEYVNGDFEAEGKESFSWFNKSEMDGHPARRFQLGWHIGVRLEYRMKYFLSLQYSTDFVRFYNHTLGEANAHINTGNFALGLGYYFK